MDFNKCADKLLLRIAFVITTFAYSLSPVVAQSSDAPLTQTNGDSASLKNSVPHSNDGTMIHPNGGTATPFAGSPFAQFARERFAQFAAGSATPSSTQPINGAIAPITGGPFTRFAGGAITPSTNVPATDIPSAGIRALKPGSSPDFQSVDHPTVSMVTLQTQSGKNGQQMVITPRGLLVPLPGAGVETSTVPIYIGSNGGWWYVDKNQQTVDLYPAVKQLKARIMHEEQLETAPVPQSAPVPQAPVQIVNNQTPQNSNNAAETALMAGTAAGLGAMAGAAMSDWGSVPYGTPVYYGAGHYPYYYHPAGRVAAVNAADDWHADRLAQQQKWYANEQAMHSERYQNWQHEKANPFVRDDAAHRANADRAAASRGASRFGGGRGFHRR